MPDAPPRRTVTGMPTSPFGAWLLDRLDERGMTTPDLARTIGRERSVVSRWLHRHKPDPEHCRAIADALRMPADEVLIAAGYMTGAPAPPTDSPNRARAKALVSLIPEPLLVPLLPMLEALVGTRASQRRLLDELAAALEHDDAHRSTEPTTATSTSSNGQTT